VCEVLDEANSAILEAVALDATEDLLGTLVGIEKAEDDLVPFELNMFSILRREFRSFARSFLDSKDARDLIGRMADPANHTSLPDLKRQVKRAVLDAFHELAGKKLGEDFADAVGEEVSAVVDGMYEASRSATARRVGIPRDTFTVVDEQSLETLRRHNLFWIRGNYGRNVRDGIDRATAEALQQGLGRKALAEELKRQFAAQFALTDNHWITISSASLNRTRNVAQVRTYELAEVTHYEVIAVLDARTSEICQYMDGRVFSVESAVRVVNELEEAEDPEDVKQVMPWLRWDESRQAPFAVVGGRRTDLPRSGAESARANRSIEKVAPLPPYHGRCRTTTAVSVETVRR